MKLTPAQWFTAAKEMAVKIANRHPELVETEGFSQIFATITTPSPDYFNREEWDDFIAMVEGDKAEISAILFSRDIDE